MLRCSLLLLTTLVVARPPHGNCSRPDVNPSSSSADTPGHVSSTAVPSDTDQPKPSSISTITSTGAATPSTVAPVDSGSGDGDSTGGKALTLGISMIYDLDNSPIGAPEVTSQSGVKVDADVYIIDMEGHSAEQIKAYKDAGKKVICYFSSGTFEPVRSDVGAFEPACVCGTGYTLDSSNHCSGGNTKMDDWDEYWLDLHSDSCKPNVKNVMTSRIKAAKAKGCDGMDPDNVDSYANGAPHGNTKQDQIDYLLWLAEAIHQEGMIVDLKNSPELVQSESKLVEAFDFSVIESCKQYDECDDYSPFLTAGKPQILVEYENSITSCPSLKNGQTLAVYSGGNLNSKQITLYCPNPGA